MKLCVAGGGKMAEALVGGLIATGWAEASQIGIIEIVDERRSYLAETFNGIALAASCAEACGDPSFDVRDVLVAVKPQHVADVAAELGAGGTRPARSASRLVCASMPCWPASVPRRASCGPCPTRPHLSDKARRQSLRRALRLRMISHGRREILSAVGTVTVVEERDLDAVTGLSGSGPAYVFLLAEAMIAAGIEQGLAPEVADALGRQTILGAASLLADSSETPAQLRSNVTSPGGTTAAAIEHMQSEQLEEIVGQAIAAATARSVELGG